MKNNKGFTMVELMFSVIIIAIIMAFLVQLLIDINYDKTNELYDTANNFNRAEIIKNIEHDFVNNELTNVSIGNSTITLTNSKGTGTITIDRTANKEYISYKNVSGTQYKWKLEKNNNETYIHNVTSKCRKKGNNYYLTINIPIIINKTKAVEKDSKMDDILLTFYSTHAINGIGCVEYATK